MDTRAKSPDRVEQPNQPELPDYIEVPCHPNDATSENGTNQPTAGASRSECVSVSNHHPCRMHMICRSIY